MQTIYKSGQELIQQMQLTRVAPGSVAIWSLGQAGVVIKGSGDNGFLCIDPYLTFSIEVRNPSTEFVREFAPPLNPSDLGLVQGVLITHFHDDHLDLSTLVPLMNDSDQTQLAVPASHIGLLSAHNMEGHRIIAARHQETFEIAGFRITPMAVAHTEDELDEHGNHVFLGYLLEVDGIRLVHTGDTVIFPGLVENVRAFSPDVVMLPINGRDYARTQRNIVGNMTAREAADFAHEVQADLMLPMHYDMFANNRDNPAYFVDYLFQTYRRQKFHMMIAGERFIYMK